MAGGIVMTIDEYAREIGLYGLTLDELINSHRELRNSYWNMISREREIMDKARKSGYSTGKREAMELGFISVQKLAKMTMLEVLNLIDDIYVEET
jgi:hypothetical protein